MELVRRQDMAGAIAYARKHLSQWAGPFEAEMQRAFAVLIFAADTQCGRYQVGMPPCCCTRGCVIDASYYCAM